MDVIFREERLVSAELCGKTVAGSHLCNWEVKASVRELVKVNPECGVNPLNHELNPICYLLALLAHHFLHVSRIRVKSLTIRLLMSYIYGAPILDVSRSHKTTHHSR